MSNEVSDTVTKIKEKAMEAMLPRHLPTAMRERFIELSHKMSPAEIAEVGRRFQEGHKKAMEKWKKQQEQKATT